MPETFQLAIESSSARASVALARAGKLVFEAGVDAGRRPSEVLMEPLSEALAKAAEGGIGLILVGTGPGSYNGARVGIAAGQGIGIVHRCPAVGICSLEAIAPVRAGGACLAVGDARRGSFFTLKIREGNLSGDLELLEHEVFLEQLRGALEAGAGLVSLEDPERLKLPEEMSAKVEWATPSATLLLAAWEGKDGKERERLLKIPPEPFYLRPPHITEAGVRGKDSGVAAQG